MGRDFRTDEDWDTIGYEASGTGNSREQRKPDFPDDNRNSYDLREQELDAAIERRRSRRKKERRMKRNFSIILILLLAAAAVFVYAKVLVPRDADLPWPSFLGTRPEQAAFSQKSGTNAGTAMTAKVQRETQPQTQTAAQAETALSQAQTATAQSETAAGGANADITAQAAVLSAGYDYDKAIALLQTIPDYESDASVTQLISGYQAQKDACTAVDVTTVPHIFYHSLLNDTGRAFNVQTLGQSQVDGFNAWMVTTGEFDQVTQKLYDAGYVYVRLRDLVTETTDADGTPHFAPNTNLMLPEGKKPIVLSVDDTCYYHSYEPAGFPDKLVLDSNGVVKCHYVDADGKESVGDYDVVPRLESFLREHPDGAYHGARGMMALTGYNGVFGYRTDTDYVKKEHLMDDQKAWLDAHPDFNYDQDVADAKKIAEALKQEGWEFASHTWGHLSVTDKTVDELKTDNEKWVATVKPIVGDVDTIIFAHGNDIGDWTGYDGNAKYDYFNSAGYHFYCNVDGSVPYWVQITDKYVRQGRIDVDGYRLWLAKNGQDNSLSKLIDTTGIFDEARPTPVVANGMS